MDLTHLLLSLVLIFAGAKILGELAGRIGQPAVLGEMAAGVILGVGVLKVVNPQAEILVLLADVGVIILLFEAGVATDLKELLAAGWRSLAVACIGVVVPFAGGYLIAAALGYNSLVAVFLGAMLTATSVGLTVRVLSDLGKIGTREAKIILGAAVADDIIGLVILAVVRDLGLTGDIQALKIIKIGAMAVGFFAAAIILGGVFAKQLVQLVEKMRVRGALIVAAVAFALLWALAAAVAGSAAIVGAFAAGLALGRTHKAEVIARDLRPVAFIFTPIFFVTVGAAVDVRYLNPFNPANHPVIAVAAILIVVAVAGKLCAGLGAVGKGINAPAVGIGMAPRGEVGLIFADVGRRAGIVSPDLFAAVIIVIAFTTFMTPPLLKFALLERPPRTPLVVWLFEPARKSIQRMLRPRRDRKSNEAHPR